jgi:hypothetical protein
MNLPPYGRQIGAKTSQTRAISISIIADISAMIPGDISVLEGAKTMSKIERERAALRQAEVELEERRKRLEEMEREEEERELQKLVKRLSTDKAISVLKCAAELGSKRALEALESAIGTASKKPAAEAV